MVTSTSSKSKYVTHADQDQPRVELLLTLLGAKLFTSTTPATISTRPKMVRQSSACSKNRYPNKVMRKIPSPDHVAYTTAIGSVFRARVKQ